ncbi:chemotaxis response regulator protein-glutamate methylesterase [Burkholderia multivorans]|uniref:Protein-glutamate methylesterase/protein-glutamine glutaminase n=2 Tax=Burkholderia multivorans TaxID=87883 RepID=A0AAP2HHJ2_9BURK|nr:chemotaxis response regulator protein-glutamate methylesterase [Burkholderia multivorans]MBU9150313.1 chemotaxis response regulator protein-glutamate methylesterase [Burkholderia multivorans]MBU9247647.1 chemotaxis response regulator protein-glutamate methylesterase [Burkholderia multivorans]MBU9356248.1 chemotaxis response regulator protein-glutamate methylesterase [Burkholderia multivorans]MBU9362480.1 chemotaxis response regulator protein-glutamate methylesterase [Burkholderia multivorans
MNIGIVNDLPLAVEALRRVLAQRPDHRVLWVAADGDEAVDFCVAHPPDLVLMDLVMPRLDGVAATRAIMARAPCAILIVTASVSANTSSVYEAMGAGALDAVDTPTLALGLSADAPPQPLLAKIDQIGRLLDSRAPAFVPLRPPVGAQRQPTLVAIGASAGGPTALATLLRMLPADFPAAIVIVQHVDQAFALGMAEWLDGHTRLPVRVARHGCTPRAGEVLLAATNDHLCLSSRGVLGYTREPAETPYRPSIDVFFDSVAECWRGDALGVLLTGMGRDGALGLKAMRAKGCYTIAQDEATSAVYGMPKAAAAIGAASAILPLDRIAPQLIARVARRAARP